MVEHDLAKVGAAGSSPVSRSFYFPVDLTGVECAGIFLYCICWIRQKTPELPLRGFQIFPLFLSYVKNSHKLKREFSSSFNLPKIHPYYYIFYIRAYLLLLSFLQHSLNYIFCSSSFSFNCNHTLFSHSFQ